MAMALQNRIYLSFTLICAGQVSTACCTQHGNGVVSSPCAIDREECTDVKSFDELYQIGKESNNTLLLFNVMVSQMSVHFWFKDYTAIMKLCEKHPAPATKHTVATYHCFYRGVAALNLARQQTNELNYRVIGVRVTGRSSLP